MVITIQPKESNDSYEELDLIENVENAEPKENVETPQILGNQILLESLLNRIGIICFLSSIVLFIGQTVNTSLFWDLDISSVITGYGLSILLFLAWACIRSVYGKGGLKVRLIQILDSHAYLYLQINFFKHSAMRSFGHFFS